MVASRSSYPNHRTNWDFRAVQELDPQGPFSSRHVTRNLARNQILPLYVAGVFVPVKSTTRQTMENVVPLLPLAHPVIESLVDRVQTEFLEMPGLRLTLLQAQRLFDVDSAACAIVFDTLTRANFLSCDRHGRFAR
jgi:hypothetical protein